MARLFHLRIALDDSRGDTLAGAVLLRIRGVVVLDWRRVGIADSALALARAAGAEHRAASHAVRERDAEGPLFGAAESADGRRDDGADFSVAHAGNTVVLSDFSGCAVPRETRFEVPWSAFAGGVIRLGDLAIRRGVGLSREELRMRLRPIRRRRRTLVRAEAPPS